MDKKAFSACPAITRTRAVRAATSARAYARRMRLRRAIERSRSIMDAVSSAICARRHAQPAPCSRPTIGRSASASAPILSGRRPGRTSSSAATSERKAFRRSLHIRHVDAGSCNGCESELQALNNPFYNLHRLGVFFTPSPRFADLLLVTGPVTKAMHEPLRAAYDAMPEPRWVMAVGTCAVSGGIAGGNYACGTGLDGVLAVDVYLPGCPPNPAAIMEALLMFLERAPQRVRGGRLSG